MRGHGESHVELSTGAPGHAAARPVNVTKPISGGASFARVSGLTATSIVVADMVGVGVFTSLGFQVKDITSGFSLLALWIIGGIVAMCGAISYAELALMFPARAGNTISCAGSTIRRSASWRASCRRRSALRHRSRSPPWRSVSISGPSCRTAPLPWPGLGIVWLISLVHLMGIRHGSAFQNIWTAIKLS